MKRLVARYSASKALPAGIFLLCLVVLAFATTLYSPDGRTIAPMPTNMKVGLAFQLVVWIGGALLAPIVVVFFWQLLFNGGAAIWVENGRMVYLHRWYQSVGRNDIDQITGGTLGNTNKPGITLHLTNGRTIEIPTSTMSEPTDVILRRLKDQLNA